MARAVCAGAPSCWKMYPLHGQQSSAVVNKTWKETANVVHRFHVSALVNKVESSLATNMPAETITCCANFSCSARRRQLSIAARPDSVVLVADRRV